MERRGWRLSEGHLAAFFFASLGVVILSFFFLRFAHGASPPTVAITLDDYSLTSTQTATVTFTFSSTPFGFDSSDVDASGASGTLTALAASSTDPSVYTATFTPFAGTVAANNVIKVGTAWTDVDGVSPTGPSFSPNFTIGIAPPAGSAACASPTVTIARPNGGETLVAGSDVDVLWSVSGCQALTASLLLSTDGGGTYSQTATSSQPSSGYLRWTVPNMPSTTSLLQLKLLGQGGVVMASDVSDGAFTVQSAPGSAGGGTTPPPSPPPTSGTPPTPTSPPASSGTTSPTAPPASTGTTSPPASGGTPTPVAAGRQTGQAPATTSTPPPKSRTAPPGPMAPPMPNIPMPLAAANPTPVIQTPPTDTAMTTGNQNPTSNAAPTTSLGSVQSAAETASSFVPSWLDSTFSFALGALTMLGLLLGTQQVLKQRAAKNTQPCSKCKGTGRESAKKQTPQTCDTCGGTGQVEDENEPDVECKHCEGEGEDPCHACKGSGKDSAGNECPSCKGGGKTLTGKKDKEGEDEVADCEVCHGEGELSATVKKMITCDKCNGTGKL